MIVRVSEENSLNIWERKIELPDLVHFDTLSELFQQIRNHPSKISTVITLVPMEAGTELELEVVLPFTKPFKITIQPVNL